MQKVPIPTAHLFPLLDHHLIVLLRSLRPEDWERATIAGKWTVKDVAAHLLDGNIRLISMMRDNHTGKRPPKKEVDSFEGLVDYLNRLNADWVKAMKRASPALITELLAITGPQYCRQVEKLAPFSPAIFPVSWAGDASSPNWFHIAREYTEKWHHQQQIRDAVSLPGLMGREFYHPVLSTFMMALPYTYRNVEAPEGTVVQVSITGEAGGDWFITQKEKWVLGKENDLPAAAHITIDGDVAWKLFTKSWRKKDVKNAAQIDGNRKLGKTALEMVSVMA